MNAYCYNYLPCPPALPSVPTSQWVATPFACPVTQARRWSLKEPLLPHASQYCWFFLGNSSCICCLSFPMRAKSLQSYPTLLWPYGMYPSRFLCPRGFFRQEYWSGLPFPSPGHLPHPGIELVSPEAPIRRRILYRWSDCKVKIPSAILTNKKCHSHQWFLASKCEWGFPKLQSTGCCHTPQWMLRTWGNARSKVNKEIGLAPEGWSAYERNEFSELRGFHLPIHRTLNSLTWYLIFDVQTACSLCHKRVYSLTSLPANSSEQFCQNYWDAISQARSPKHSHQIK